MLSVQPRSNAWRYRLDNRTHTLTGYNIFMTGVAEGEEKQFVVAISEKHQVKLRCHIGDVISGTGWTKKYPDLEYADYYRAGALKKTKEGPAVGRRAASRGRMRCRSFRCMTGAAAGCWIRPAGIRSVLPANGRRWRMSRSSITGA